MGWDAPVNREEEIKTTIPRGPEEDKAILARWANLRPRVMGKNIEE
jgi:hypothetical protein